MVRDQLEALDSIELYQAYLRCWTDTYGEDEPEETGPVLKGTRQLEESDIGVGSDN